MMLPEADSCNKIKAMILVAVEAKVEEHLGAGLDTVALVLVTAQASDDL